MKRIMTLACRDCRFFNGDPASIEAEFPGLKSLSSAYSSVRADAGICNLRELFVSPSRGCKDFERTAEFHAG